MRDLKKWPYNLVENMIYRYKERYGVDAPEIWMYKLEHGETNGMQPRSKVEEMLNERIAAVLSDQGAAKTFGSMPDEAIIRDRYVRSKNLGWIETRHGVSEITSAVNIKHFLLAMISEDFLWEIFTNAASMTLDDLLKDVPDQQRGLIKTELTAHEITTVDALVHVQPGELQRTVVLGTICHDQLIMAMIDNHLSPWEQYPSLRVFEAIMRHGVEKMTPRGLRVVDNLLNPAASKSRMFGVEIAYKNETYRNAADKCLKVGGNGASPEDYIMVALSIYKQQYSNGDYTPSTLVWGGA